MAYRKKSTARRAPARSSSRRSTGGRRPARRSTVSKRSPRRSNAGSARPQQLKIVIEHAPAGPDYGALMAQGQSTVTKRKGRF